MSYRSIPECAVVVGVEKWPAAAESVSWAAEQAFRAGRDLCLLHVVSATILDTPPGFRAGAPSEPEEDYGSVILASAGRYAEHRLDELSGAAEFVGHRRPEVTVELRSGSVAAVLGAASERASMLVLASRGRRPIRSRVLGSVARSTIKDAHCPVVVLPPRSGGVGRGVLVGIDGTADSVPALEFAFDQAAQRHLPLSVLYCYRPDGPMQSVGDRLMVAESVAGLRELYPDAHPRLRIQAGRPLHVLADQAQTMHMVVVGGSGGGVARRLLDHAHSVVVVVPAVASRAGATSQAVLGGSRTGGYSTVVSDETRVDDAADNGDRGRAGPRWPTP